MSVTPRRASAAWNPGSALTCSPLAVYSANVMGGWTPGTGTVPVTDRSSRDTVTTVVWAAPSGTEGW